MKKKLTDFLFLTTMGTVILMCFCTVLFIITLGIGYLVIGLALSSYTIKKGKTSFMGSDSLGIILVWPVAILLQILDE